MATRQAATDAQLVSALQASVSGDVIELTASRDYLVTVVAGIDCRPDGVTIRNAPTVNARITTSDVTNEGFRDCHGLNFTGVRFGKSKFWGGGNVHITAAPAASGLYFQGNHQASSITDSTFKSSGFGMTLDGRRAGQNLWVENFTVARNTFNQIGVDPIRIFGLRDSVIEGNTFNQIGVDPIRIFGLRDSVIEGNTMTDVSSYRYSGNQTSGRLHSDGIDATQMDRVTIRNNVFDLIEWQAIILKNHGYYLGWPQHLMRDIVIEGNDFGRVGFANFPEIGASGGGCGIFIQDCQSVTVKNNRDLGGITRAALNHFHLWDSQPYLDPAYGTLNAQGTAIDYHVDMKVFAGGNVFQRVLNTPPGGGWMPSNGPTLLPLESARPPAELEFVVRDTAGNLSAPKRISIPIA